MKKYLLPKDGNFYKANLHVHSTYSDGRWMPKEIKKAYMEKGLIIFTDPDYSGEEIRRKLTARFPESGQAFLTKNEAEKKGDIGIENACPEDIAEAIRKAHYTGRTEDGCFTEDDLFEAGLHLKAWTSAVLPLYWLYDKSQNKCIKQAKFCIQLHQKIG